MADKPNKKIWDHGPPSQRQMQREQFHQMVHALHKDRCYNDELTSFYMWANSHELLVAVRHPFGHYKGGWLIKP